MIKYLLSDFIWNGHKLRCIRLTYYGGDNFIDDLYELIALLQVDGWIVFADTPERLYSMNNDELLLEFNSKVGLQSLVYPPIERLSVYDVI